MRLLGTGGSYRDVICCPLLGIDRTDVQILPTELIANDKAMMGKTSLKSNFNRSHGAWLVVQVVVQVVVTALAHLAQVNFDL